MDRKVIIKNLKQQDFDVLIIGAGINGAVSAASLSQRGYRVALIDQGDFASQTSQASSNLIWGGIKYLENYEFSLVNQLCRSRNQLMDAFPSLIREIRFFLPAITSTDPGNGRKNWKRHPLLIYVGMWLYWLLGRFHTKPPKRFSSAQLRDTGYPLSGSFFRGALEYSDAYLPENDSRFVYRFIQRAMVGGGVVVNYVKLKKRVQGEEYDTYSVEDQVNKTSFNVRSKFLVNATGPFIDGINQSLSISTQHQHLFSKGIHLIFPRFFPDEKVISFFDEDDRLFFAIPMGSRTMVGTTDNRIEEPVAEVTEEDREFLLRNINHFLTPEQQLSQKDIIAERCGVRPLVVKSQVSHSNHNHKKDSSWFHLSRKHSLEVNGRVLSIFGGKLTDCLNIGEEVFQEIKKRLPQGSDVKPGQWYGEEPDAVRREYEREGKKYLPRFPEIEPFLSQWWARYGSGVREIFALLEKRKKISEIFDSGYTDVELIYMIEKEQVVNREDLFRRRTKLDLVVKKNELLKHPVIQEIIQEYCL